MAAKITLNSGHTIPTLGLGTFKATAPGEVKAAVKAAVCAGYRLIDCAAGYGNQKEVGAAIAELIADGVVTRDELFVVSKLFQTHHHWDGDDSRCHETLEQTLSDLQLEYLDLFLIHWPFAFLEKKLEKPEGTPQPLRLPDGSPNPIWTIRMEYLKTWACMETMVAAEKVRSIGVSNFTIAQLGHLQAAAQIPPAVNQVECHLYLQQEEMLRWCAEQKIAVMGYSPLGSSAQRYPETHGVTLLNHPAVKAVAEECGQTTGQVLIRWGRQKYPETLISIPKSSRPERIKQNFAVTGWELSEGAMQALDGLESDFRYFISYLKKPDNQQLWHDGKTEQGNDSDFVSSS
jgi:diketogulonate reductase-like aldo/keto reductase